jgi:hypothetical protein
MSTNAKPFESPVIVALNATAKHRWHAADISAEARSAEAEPGDIGCAVAAVIESTAAKIAANDFSGIEVALASQALTLDVIFDQYARRSAKLDLFDHPMNMALRAQSQCRVTFKNLVALKNPHASQASSGRTIETAKRPALADS